MYNNITYTYVCEFNLCLFPLKEGSSKNETVTVVPSKELLKDLVCINGKNDNPVCYSYIQVWVDRPFNKR